MSIQDQLVNADTDLSLQKWSADVTAALHRSTFNLLGGRTVSDSTDRINLQQLPRQMGKSMTKQRIRQITLARQSGKSEIQREITKAVYFNKDLREYVTEDEGITKPVSIYRVEQEGGTGLYRDAGLEIMEDMGEDYSLHPLAHRDTKLMQSFARNYPELGERQFYGNLHFGFTDVDQVKMWIHHQHTRTVLGHHGYKLAVYECSRAAIGDTQAMFKKDEAVLLYHLELTDV